MNSARGRRSRPGLSASQLTLLVAGTVALTACTGGVTSPPLSSNSAMADSASSAGEVEEGVPAAAVEHRTYELPTSVVQVVTVPPQSGHTLAVAWSADLATLSQQAQAAGAIAAINAGFFDPQNGLTTSYVITDGAVVADPRQNPRLMENPDLQTILPAILDRSEFRVYNCADGVQYDITTHATPIPATCVLVDAVGAGPQLLPTLTGYEEGFMADNDAGERVRDALGSQWPNARSAVGLKADGTVVLAIAAQRPESDTPSGLTLPQMADFLASLGVTKALNLDGGSSTGLYFDGHTDFGKLDAEGAPIERPIKSVLVVR